MLPLNQQRILITGLPGAGKTRVATSLKEQFACERLSTEQWVSDVELRSGYCEWHDYLNLPSKKLNQSEASEQVWCVIDVRSTLEEAQAEWIDDILQNLLRKADAIILSFVENASLEQQAWWNRRLNEKFELLKINRPPVYRWFYQQFADDFIGFESKSSNQVEPIHVDEREEVFHYDVAQIMLDHLFMGLDNSKRNLQMKITRVSAVVDTFEFDNLIAIEGTPYRLDKFAADDNQTPGKLVIKGIGLDKNWLDQLVQASTL